jgi:adenine deaminase
MKSRTIKGNLVDVHHREIFPAEITLLDGRITSSLSDLN